MDIQALNKELQAEVKRINAVLEVLNQSKVVEPEILTSTLTPTVIAPTVIPNTSSASVKRRHRRPMSAETKQKISIGRKNAWTRIKGKRSPMSAEARGKISAAQKARWGREKENKEATTKLVAEQTAELVAIKKAA